MGSMKNIDSLLVTLAIAGSLAFASYACVAQDKPQDKPKPLTAEQTVALYKANDKMQTALEKVKATKEYAEYMAALNEYNQATLDAMKGVDQKKWTLGKYYEWIPVK